MAESKPSRKEIRDASLLKIVTETGYHLESYFDRLKDYTFNTTWMELTQNYAKALVEARARRLRGEKESDLIQQLSADIDESIKKLGCEKVFVRMSTRSAKDVALQREQALIIFQEEDKKLIEETQNKYREDVRHMISLIRTTGKAMSVTSGKEAVAMFIDSQRIYEDLTTSLQTLSEFPRINISIRQFVPLRCELEIRVFVVNERITAMSQYYSSCFVPWLAEKKQFIQQRIEDCFAEINPIINLNSYVIDFAFDYDDRLWVVEVNLPPPAAGMALFDRNLPADINIVNGSAEFEFRINTTDDPSIDLRKNHRMFFDRLKEHEAKAQLATNKNTGARQQGKPKRKVSF